MAIDGIDPGVAGLFSGSGLRVTELQRDNKTAQSSGDAAAQTAAVTDEARSSTASTVSGGTRNMLSGNFYDASRGPSQYVRATVEAFGIADRMAQAGANDLLSTLDQFGGITVARVYSPGDKTAGAGASENEIKSALKRERDKELVEKADEEFRQEREAEAAAQEEAAGTGDGPAQAAADAASAGSADSAPDVAPEAGSSDGAAVSETAAAAAPATPAVTSGTPSDTPTAAYAPVDVFV